MTSDEKRIPIDPPTLISVSILAWALLDILHEIVGHAGAAVLLGLPVKAVSTTTAYIDVDWPRMIKNQGQSRAIRKQSTQTLAGYILRGI